MVMVMPDSKQTTEDLALDLFREVHRRVGHQIYALLAKEDFNSIPPRKAVWVEVARAFEERLAPRRGRGLDYYAADIYERVRERLGGGEPTGPWAEVLTCSYRLDVWREVALVLSERLGETATLHAKRPVFDSGEALNELLDLFASDGNNTDEQAEALMKYDRVQVNIILSDAVDRLNNLEYDVAKEERRLCIETLRALPENAMVAECITAIAEEPLSPGRGEHREPVPYRPGDYVALGPMFEIVASDSSRQRAKEKAIVAGVSAPLVVPASQVKGAFVAVSPDFKVVSVGTSAEEVKRRAIAEGCGTPIICRRDRPLKDES